MARMRCHAPKGACADDWCRELVRPSDLPQTKRALSLSLSYLGMAAHIHCCALFVKCPPSRGLFLPEGLIQDRAGGHIHIKEFSQRLPPSRYHALATRRIVEHL